MTIVHVPLPDDVFSTVRKAPEEVAREMRIAVAVQWYAHGLISQGQGAEIGGLTRSEFIDAISEAGVSPFQESAEDIRRALASE